MKTKYKSIHFVRIQQKPKISMWECRTNIDNDILGQVKWCSWWKRHCYFPVTETFYDKGCLDDIGHFMKQLKEET